jgi:DNA-binding response OmpR family regulator
MGGLLIALLKLAWVRNAGHSRAAASSENKRQD